MLISELFTEFYTGGSHASAAHYLYFGQHGLNALQPWIWTSTICVILAAFLLLKRDIHERKIVLNFVCVLIFVGIWIEKGMGLIIPGFIPSTLHEWVEYIPSALEWKISAGIWAAGLIVYTLLLKVAIPIFTGEAGKLAVKKKP